MPMKRADYPQDWEIKRVLILARAGNRCECMGECGLHGPNPKPRRCCELNHKPARYARGKVILTMAHMCSCSPLCSLPGHLRAMCQRCHLRVDRQQHVRTRAARRANTPQTPPTTPGDTQTHEPNPGPA